MTSAPLRKRRTAAHIAALLAWAALRRLVLGPLAVRLQVVNGETAAASGEEEAARHAVGRFDRARIEHYIAAVSDAQAKGIVRSLERDMTPSTADEVWAAFEQRATMLGSTYANGMLNFGVHEFGDQQPGEWTKTWHTTSDDPRATHAALDGVTVPLDARFANSLHFPCDPEGDAAETSGCRCELSIGREGSRNGDR
jgi:hypothetical protein